MDNFIDFLDHYKQKNNIDYFDFISITNATRLHYERQQYHNILDNNYTWYPYPQYSFENQPQNIWSYPQNPFENQQKFPLFVPPPPPPTTPQLKDSTPRAINHINHIKELLDQEENGQLDTTINYYIDNTYELRVIKTTSKSHINDYKYKDSIDHNIFFNINWVSRIIPPHTFIPINLPPINTEQNYSRKEIKNIRQLIDLIIANNMCPNTQYYMDNKYYFENIKAESTPYDITNPNRLCFNVFFNIRWFSLLKYTPINNLQELIELAKKNPRNGTERYYFPDENTYTKIREEVYSDKKQFDEIDTNTLTSFMYFLNNLPLSFDMLQKNNAAKQTLKSDIKNPICSLNDLINLAKTPFFDMSQYGFFTEESRKTVRYEFNDPKNNGILDVLDPTIQNNIRYLINNLQTYSNLDRNSVEPIAINNIQELIELAKKNPRNGTEQYYFADENTKQKICKEYCEKLNELSGSHTINFIFYLNNLSTSLEMLQKNNAAKQTDKSVEHIAINNLQELIELAKKNPPNGTEQYYFPDNGIKIQICDDSRISKKMDELSGIDTTNFGFFLSNLSTSIEILKKNNATKQNLKSDIKNPICRLKDLITIAKTPNFDMSQYGFFPEQSKKEIMDEFTSLTHIQNTHSVGGGNECESCNGILDGLSPTIQNNIKYLINNLQTYTNLDRITSSELSGENLVNRSVTSRTVNIDFTIESIKDLVDLLDKNPYDPTAKYNIDLKGLHQIRHELVELDTMVGIRSLKHSILNQLIYFIQEPILNDSVGGYKHTILCGPPGTGKTEIAKIIGKMYSKLGILKNSVFKKVTRNDLVAGYLGQTAIKTKEVIEKCLGGCLFIDEAYSLGHSSKNDSFSKECIDILCEALSDHNDNLMVIIAGYENELDECFFSLNSGLKSRFSWKFKIEEYSAKELCKIFEKKVGDSGWQTVKCEFLGGWFENNIRYFKNYGRDVEQLLYYVKICHSRRIYGKSEDLVKKITKDDIEKGYKCFLENHNEKTEQVHYGLYV